MSYTANCFRCKKMQRIGAPFEKAVRANGSVGFSGICSGCHERAYTILRKDQHSDAAVRSAKDVSGAPKSGKKSAKKSKAGGSHSLNAYALGGADEDYSFSGSGLNVYGGSGLNVYGGAKRKSARKSAPKSGRKSAPKSGRKSAHRSAPKSGRKSRR
jgi:hypothetical protein